MTRGYWQPKNLFLTRFPGCDIEDFLERLSDKFLCLRGIRLMKREIEAGRENSYELYAAGCQILSQMPSSPVANNFDSLGYDSQRSIKRRIGPVYPAQCVHPQVHRSATPPRDARIAV